MIRVLIADDHPVFRFGLRTLLKADPAMEVVGEAVNGEDAIAQASSLHPDVILMDLNMPGMNGCETTQAIHAHCHGKTIPVVAVSADCVGYGYQSRAFEKGFIACVRKPWEQEALIKIVTKMLRSGVKRHACFQMESA